MTAADIAVLRGLYAAATRLAVAAGFDIVMIGAAEADNIICQFLMPFYNQRTDCYDGPLANRAPFLAEVTETVREAASSRAAVAIRLCIDTLDGTETGIRAGIEGRAIIGQLDHLADYWDVQAGGWGSARWGTDPVSADRPVLVIGAGPAGLECAMTLVRRGFSNVHVADSAPRPGGQLAWMTALPGLAEWRKITDYRVGQITRYLDVELHPHTTLGLDAVLAYGAEIVIFATGVAWAADGLNWATGKPVPGAGLPNVHSPGQVPGLTVPPGARAVVYGCDGGHVALSAARLLAQRGAAVTVITPFGTLAPDLEHTHDDRRAAALLDRLGVQVLPSLTLTQVEPGKVTTAGSAPAARPSVLPADLVVLVTQRLSRDRLYRDLQGLSPRRLRDAGIAVYRVGDCVAPRRRLAAAIFDGYRLARAIGTADPAKAAPFLRETSLPGGAL